MLTVQAIYDKENRNLEFNAALQGVDIKSNNKEAIQDVTSLVGAAADKAGFGIGQGLGLVVEE